MKRKNDDRKFEREGIDSEDLAINEARWSKFVIEGSRRAKGNSESADGPGALSFRDLSNENLDDLALDSMLNTCGRSQTDGDEFLENLKQRMNPARSKATLPCLSPVFNDSAIDPMDSTPESFEYEDEIETRRYGVLALIAASISLPVLSLAFLFMASNSNVNVAEPNLQGPKSPACLLYTSPSPRDLSTSRMPSSA